MPPHAAQVPVVVIQHSSHAPDAATFRHGTYGWELHPDVKKRPRDVLIEKTLPGSFSGTTLDTWLRNRGISSVTIAGYMTQMCCDTTARQAFHNGYGVKFLSDATGTLGVTNRAGIDQRCRPAPGNPRHPADAVLAGHDNRRMDPVIAH